MNTKVFALGLALLCLPLMPMAAMADDNHDNCRQVQRSDRHLESRYYRNNPYRNGTQAYRNNYNQYQNISGESLRTFPLTRQLTRPVNVYVDTRSRLYEEQFMGYVGDSLKAWSNALDGRLTYRLTDNPNNADITVGWVTGFSDRSKAGEAAYRVGHANIRIKTQDIPDKEIKGNIMHELGHALGISGHSPNQNDIMAGSRRWNYSSSYEPRLSSRDKEAIRQLYSANWQPGENLYVAVNNNPYGRTTYDPYYNNNPYYSNNPYTNGYPSQYDPYYDPYAGNQQPQPSVSTAQRILESLFGGGSSGY